MSELHIAEIPFEDGGIRFRYARKLSPDGTRWIRDGLFQAFHRSGILASEGLYRDGLEQGTWRTFHETGHLAAEGDYHLGDAVGGWRYWNSEGQEEAPDKG